MPLRWRRKVVAFKEETTYGTDAGPTAAANAVLVRNFGIRPLEALYDKRSFDAGYSGHLGELVAGQHVETTFEVEMAGSGTVDVAPAYGPLLKCCGCSQTITATVKVVYAPVHPGAGSSGSMYFWLDGRLHKVLGNLGDVTLNWPRNRAPFYAFRFLGLYVGPLDQAVPAPTLSAFKKPVPVNNANTTPMTLHGFAGKFGDLSVTLGNNLVYRNLPNSEAIRWIDRESTGQVRLEDELIATKDWYTIVKNETLGALAITHGPATNQVVFDAANVQLTRPAIGAEDMLSMKSLAMILQPSSAGNDEWSITTK
jgi:hypothetical protein